MFESDLKFLLRFKTSALYEEISHSFLSAIGSDPVIQIISNGGYAMKDNQYLLGSGLTSVGYGLGISSEFTIGFWLYSIHPGVHVNDSTGVVESIEMPFIDLNEVGSNNTSIFKLSEKTTADGENYLTIYMNDSTYAASTENYIPNKWHHFWLAYNGSNLYIYVDGKLQTLQNEYGSLPSSLFASYADVYINHSIVGYSDTVSKNYGYLSDLFIFSSYHNSEIEVQRNINDGIMYVADYDYRLIEIEKLCVSFNDPNTVSISSLIDDMSYVYIGRNDGKILRGSPLLWEVRKTFSSEEEIEQLDLDNEDIQNGFLHLKNKNVRL